MEKNNKILHHLLGLVSLGTFGYASYKLFQLYKKDKNNKKGEQKSSADGLKTTTFTLTNNTSQNQTQYLFDSRSGQNNSNVGILPSMGFFDRELSNKPKKLMKIEFRKIDNPIVSKYNQAEAPFKMICKDASGNSSTQQYTPLISSNQYQGGITSVNFGGKILDGECYMAYTMFPKSKVALVLYYEDMPLSSLLDKKKEKNQLDLHNSNTMKTNSNETVEKNTKGALISTFVVGALMIGTYKYLSSPKYS